MREQPSFTVAALYHFTQLGDLDNKKSRLEFLCEKMQIRGTILLADEGINGTIAGNLSAIKDIVAHIKTWNEIDHIELKFSTSQKMNFNRMKVKIKKEIVTMGQEINVAKDSGQYVKPQDWNSLISRDDVLLIDTRNQYETRIGNFQKAIDPRTDNFQQFPKWADDLKEETDLNTKIAMYCTGGIRCEKATAYMRQLGFQEIYHLQGGILKYLEEIPEEESLWEGECFVFDDRVSLQHGLQEGEYALCYACQEPISAEDRNSSKYEEGVSCEFCYETITDEQRNNFRERQRQIYLAYSRGENHLGMEARRKQEKY